jgi:catechol-2,3-dioxygenase
MAWGAISQMGYVAMHAKDIERSVQHAQDILGLTVTERNDRAVFLSSAARKHHELVYLDAPEDSVGHFGLVAAGAAGLATVRRRVRELGLQVISESPLHPGVADGFSFMGPEGYVFEVYVDMDAAELATPSHRPERYGHINIHPQDPTAFKNFLVEVFDFKVVDVIGTDFVYFLRCSTDHHGIALVKGPGWLHHHAWQAQSIADLGKLGDRLWEAGSRLLMGPVRHGESSRNIAAYYIEPGGSVVELYTDMRQIFDDEAATNYINGDGIDWATQWAPYDFTEFRAHGAFPARELISSI